MSTTSTVTRVYGGFRGADFRGEEVSLSRSPDCLNVWKDYKDVDGIRTRPGTQLLEGFTEPVYGVFFFRDMMLVHSGTKLYKCTTKLEKKENGLYEVEHGEVTELYAGLRPAVSDSFIHENMWYFKDGLHYLQYDGSNPVKDVEGYVPTTNIEGDPDGGSQTFQDVNLLTGRRINTFLGDSKKKVFNLAAEKIDKDFAPTVKVNDAEVSNYTVDYDAGKITFTEAPEGPLTPGQDNVSVEFSVTVAGDREKILKCTLLQVFDNRVFFSGNPDYPNKVWHCSLNDPGYCSTLDYYNEGLDTAKVTGLVAGNNALWVFREPSQANTTVFYHTPTLDADYGKIYPSQHSSVTTGCIGRAINFNDDIVFFSERGMEGISGDITTEQVVGHRSTLIDSKLLAEQAYQDMLLEEWNGYLFVFVDNKAYLADSRGIFTNENHVEYDWFYWELPQAVTCTQVQGGVLYLGTADGIYTLTDYACPVESHWATPKDKFKCPNLQKTTNKRGFVAEATGDVTVSVKTESTEFEPVSTHVGVTDYFVSRIKRKKFKDLQLKFQSDTRFSLESVTMEVFTGAYIKR
ncbi:MAG: hypothetical protein IJA47_03430 [Oscillospiraceae bacterium]|nr:hypothetical protein [Oscillospiraceae bacterium]